MHSTKAFLPGRLPRHGCFSVQRGPNAFVTAQVAKRSSAPMVTPNAGCGAAEHRKQRDHPGGRAPGSLLGPSPRSGLVGIYTHWSGVKMSF